MWKSLLLYAIPTLLLCLVLTEGMCRFPYRSGGSQTAILGTLTTVGTTVLAQTIPSNNVMALLALTSPPAHVMTLLAKTIKSDHY